LINASAHYGILNSKEGRLGTKLNSCGWNVKVMEVSLSTPRV